MRPRMAFSAVVFPAPFGPMRPRMRPVSTVRSTRSSATVGPYALRRPLASMQGMSLALLRLLGGAQQVLGLKAQALNAGQDLRPVDVDELLPFAGHQPLAGAFRGEHPKPPPLLDQAVIDESLIGLQHRQRIDPVLRGDVAHGRKRLAVLQEAVQDHRHHHVAELAVDRLGIAPLWIHMPRPIRVGVIHNYNTMSMGLAAASFGAMTRRREGRP